MNDIDRLQNEISELTKRIHILELQLSGPAKTYPLPYFPQSPSVPAPWYSYPIVTCLGIAQ